MKLNHCLLIVLSIILFNACSSNNTNPADNGSKYLIPLSIGNQWIFQVKLYDSLNNPLPFDSAGTIFTSNFTIHVVRDSTIINEKFYILNHWLDSTNFIYMTNRTDGIYGNTVRTSPNISDTTIKLFAYPAVIGYTYYSGGANLIVSATDQKVTVPAGTFTCYVFTIQEENNYKFYMAPGVGFVKIQTPEVFSQGGLAVYELTKVTLK